MRTVNRASSARAAIASPHDDTIGLIVLALGATDTSPTWDDAWDEEARRAAQVAWGAGIAALGVVAAVGALVLAGVKRLFAGLTT